MIIPTPGRSLRSVLIGVLGILLLLVLSPSTSGAQQPERVERLTIATEADKGNVTPYSFRPPPGIHSEMVGLVYDTLFLDAYTDEPIPWLATKATSDEESRVWTVKLRDDVTWHDGEKFSSEDVAFTYDYYREGPPNRYSHHASDVPVTESVEAVDDTTVEFTCAQPCPTLDLVTLADLPILPEHIWSEVEDPMTYTDLPVGTGPYTLEEHEEDQSYRFEANEDYFMGPPVAEEIVMPVVPDPQSMFLSLQSGQVDSVTLPIPPELQKKLKKNEEVELAEASRFTSVFYIFNRERPPLDQPEFRKALDLAIDREELVETVLLGNGRPGSPSFMHPDSVWFREQEADFDPDQAREMLDEAGISDSDNDGVREYEGEPVRLAVIVPANAPQPIRTAELVAGQLEEIGVELEVQSLDPGTLSQRQNSGEFDISSFTGVPHLLGDPDQMIESLRSLLVYEDPRYEELEAEWFETTTIEDRREALFEIQKLFVEDPPALTLYYPDTTFAYRPEAYDGWIPVDGHGIFHKWSLLPESWEMLGVERAAAQSAPSDGDAGESEGAAEEATTPYALIAAVVAVVLVAGLLIWRRLSRGDGEEEI